MPRLLVLWDVDYTLVNAGGVGMELYQIAFAEVFGGQAPTPGSMAGRTDRAIAIEVLTLAGVPDARRQVTAFQASMTAHAPELATLLSERGRALPGPAGALTALAALGMKGGRSGLVVQSLLTGNIRALAEAEARRARPDQVPRP